MRLTTAIIIGAGQSGLAMSWYLTRYGIDHVILERGEVANSWRTERWDSLRLLTPNWQSRLPGHAYAGEDPDGFMTMPQTAAYLDRYAQLSRAPVQTRTRVQRVCRTQNGYEIATDRGPWRCRALVLAGGAFGIPTVPALSAELPAGLLGLTPVQYKSPDHLPAGGVLVVGASASGVQIAREVQASGRRTVLAVGEHVRMPRTYRGRDIQYWMDATGAMDLRFDEIEDIARARRLPSPQLIGTFGRETIDLSSLSAMGVERVGRLVGLRSGKAQFSGSLANCCALADLKLNRLLTGIDEWIESRGLNEACDPPHRPEPTALPLKPRLDMDLRAEGIATVIWATGYRPDYSWLDVPVFDQKGNLRHEGGVVAAPDMYVLGLPFMRRRKSSFIDGAGADAHDLSAHLRQCLDRAA
ncbi:NAD(P)-binding domain-containing protein [Aestuariivirga sp.]|uniref:NAD(P)-binding domain-containing protein n=1 Tax=Aestuariivirga sp. TaxID=2650926 RepID=UPI0039E445C9